MNDSNTEMRHKALELLNTAPEVELTLVKGMTSKKFEALESIRPFSNWYEAVSTNYMSFYTLLNN